MSRPGTRSVGLRSKTAKPKLWLLASLIVLLMVGGGAIWYSRDNPLQSDSSISTRSFNKSQYSVNDASSIWAVVNKGRALPSDYAPADLVVPNVPLRLSANESEMHLRRVSATALEKLFQAAQWQNIHLMLASGYRSYSWQSSVHDYFVSSQGQTEADATSARPGHSEHQTGLAVDIEPADRHCEVELCFAQTAEGQWLAVNAYKYGFIIRYQKNSQKLTGYEFEPWHIRYVGITLAQQIHQSNRTLEQFFDLPTFTDYPDKNSILKNTQ